MKAHMISEQTITIFHNDKIYTVNASESHFDEIASYLRKGDYDAAIEEIDQVTKLTEHFGEKLQVDNGTLTINGLRVPDALAGRLIQMREEGHDIAPMERFIGNLMNNPAHHAIEELMGFLEHSDLPITDDGHFLAYKRVRDDYTDVHSGKLSNKVGEIVSMPRYEVNDNRHQTCSTGLHFASFEYLRHFSGPRLMLLKINPADVVSIPADYDNSKGRCCRYEVIKELPMPKDFTNPEDSWAAVWYGDDEEYTSEDEDE